MGEPNLIDFLLSILNGIEYGSLSTTNRAYQWMKNNSSLNGPCLNYLKNYISCDNLVAQKEMEIFKKLEKEGNLPSEEEIDQELKAYFDNAETNEFEFNNLLSYSDVLKHGDSYLKELNLAEKFLRRKQNDLEVKIKIEEKRKDRNEIEIKNSFNIAEEFNSSYNEILKNIQFELSKMALNFDKLLSENVNHEEHNIFQINFEIFKQINSTFLDTVRIVMEKQFLNVKKDTDHCDIGEGDGHENDCKKHIQTLIHVAHCFGERSFQSIQYQCEEAEFHQVNEFIENLKKDVQCEKLSIVGNTQLQSQTAANLETVDEIQEKLSILSENLEQYYKNYIVYEIFNDERNIIESKLKLDKKRLRKVLDLCAKFVDLLTLQGFLLENEKDNIDLAIDLYHKTVSTLQNHLQEHSNCVSRVQKMLQRMQTRKPCNTNVLAKFGADLLKMNLESDEKPSIEKVLNKFSTANYDLLGEVRMLADRKLSCVGTLKNSMNRLDEVLFSGPARQPFFRGSLLADKRIIESQCSDFNKIFHSLKKDYKDELEKLTTDEYIEIERSLWVMFLADSSNFLENLQKLRDKAGVNKTLITQKNENSSILTKKSNRSSHY